MWDYLQSSRIRSNGVWVIQKGRENCYLIRKDSPTYVEQTQQTVGSFTY